MKTIVKLLPLALLINFMFTSCEVDKDDNLTDEQVAQQMIISSEDHATAEDLFQHVEDEVDEAIEKSGGGNGCPTVTADPDWQTYPRTVTIDFGDGCEGPYGRSRKGKIAVEITDNILNANASRTASFDDFYIDEIKIEGARTWTNLGYDDEGNISLSRTVVDGKIIYPNGESAEWESDGVITQTEGGNTPFNFLDNIFEITGTASGVNREGQAFTANIDEALIKDKICPWIVSGVLSLTVDNVNVSLDYGEGTCDRKAILTLPNGTEHEIFIR